MNHGARVCFYAKVSLVAYVIWFASFQLVGRYAAGLPTLDPTSRWDRAIPLIPGFIWPYELCYALPLLALFVIKDFHRFNTALLAILMANLSGYVPYLLLPIAFPRPALGNSLSEQLLAFEYAADFQPGANKLPSMHVALSFIMTLAMYRQRSRLVDALNATLLVAISASTLFVKQHLLIDVLAGLFWGLAAFWLAERAYTKLVPEGSSADRALVSLHTLLWARVRAWWRPSARSRRMGRGSFGSPSA